MKPRSLSVATGLLCLLAEPAHGTFQSAPVPPQDATTSIELVLAEVAINGLPREGQFLIGRSGDRYWIRSEDLDRWRIRHAGVAEQLVDGERLVPLAALPDIQAQFDEATQRLILIVGAARFQAQQLLPVQAPTAPTAASSAVFLNYDLSFQYDERLRGNAFIETGASDDWGLVSNTMTIGRNTAGDTVTRLDSYYLRDFPDKLTRLVVGDTITDGQDWTRQVRYGGVRLGTEFGLQPALVTFPVPDFAGRAAVPSNVELLVNDAVRYQTQVDQGPFSIVQAPIVTGAGDVTLVLRDALGVERRVKTNYYVSSRLLRRGLSAWSLEAGAERLEYGLRSFHYGDPFAAGSYRWGASEWLTLESRAELSGDVQMGGGGFDMVVPAIGEFGAAAALSHGRDGVGTLYRVFLSRITPAWNLSVSYQRASRDFDQLGVDRDADRITEQLQAAGGVTLGRWGSIALSWTGLAYADRRRTQLASANYSVSIGGRAFLSLFALRSKIDDAAWSTTAGVGLTVPLGSRTSAFAQVDSRNRMAELRQTPPTGGGFGYRLSASTGQNDYQQAELRWRGDVGEASVEAARFEGRAGLRGLASGGLLVAGGRIQATRRVEDGLGVVEVPGQANVRIYQENRLVTRTDAQGRAIISDLRSYEPNRLTLAPGDLPLDAQMKSDTLVVVPRYRGAARARFEVTQDRPATILVTLPGGAPVEVGAGVIASTGEKTFVGYGGEIFVRALRAGMMLTVETGTGTCSVSVPDGPPQEALPQIGPLTCR